MDNKQFSVRELAALVVNDSCKSGRGIRRMLERHFPNNVIEVSVEDEFSAYWSSALYMEHIKWCSDYALNGSTFSIVPTFNQEDKRIYLRIKFAGFGTCNLNSKISVLRNLSYTIANFVGVHDVLPMLRRAFMERDIEVTSMNKRNLEAAITSRMKSRNTVVEDGDSRVLYFACVLTRVLLGHQDEPQA